MNGLRQHGFHGDRSQFTGDIHCRNDGDGGEVLALQEEVIQMQTKNNLDIALFTHSERYCHFKVPLDFPLIYSLILRCVAQSNLTTKIRGKL